MIEAHLVADVASGGQRWPVYAHTIDHPQGRVLVDTGMIDTHPGIAEWDARWYPLPEGPFAFVINTHLHFDHCGGNRLFAGTPIHVQRRELDDVRRGRGDTIVEWALFDGATYVEHDGEAEVLPGVRLVPTPGHTEGHQSVVVDGVGVIGGDVAYSFRDLGMGDTPGRRTVLDLGMLTWLAHVERPKVPRPT